MIYLFIGFVGRASIGTCVNSALHTTNIVYLSEPRVMICFSQDPFRLIIVFVCHFIQSQCWRSDSVSSWITHKHPQMKIVLQDAGTLNKHCIKSS